MVRYTAGTTKGDTTRGDVWNDPFALRNPDVNYTSEKVVETSAAASSAYAVSWTPAVKKAFRVFTVAGALVELTDLEMKKYGLTEDDATFYDVKITHSDSTIGYANYKEDGKTIDGGINAGDRIAYKYDNVVIPQNDLPILNAEMANIPLLAKARRIAINKYVA